MSAPQTFMHSGRSATVRTNADAWLIEWNDGVQDGVVDVACEQRALILARLFAFETLDGAVGLGRT